MFNVAELVAQSQQADLKREEDRLAAEKAAEQAWRAKAKAPGTMNTSELIAKMYGPTSKDANNEVIVVPHKTKQEETPNGKRATKFPPPPRKP